jgi:hypothetical protein
VTGGPRRLALAAFAAAALCACSSTPRASAMRIDDGALVTGRTHDARVVVRVEGGGRAAYQIHDAAFEDAVAASLAETKTFTAIVEAPPADYQLDVRLGDLRQPAEGGNAPTQMTVLWSVSRVDTQETVWQELIATDGISHNPIAVLRLRGGVENAARKNIREALARLAEAPL